MRKILVLGAGRSSSALIDYLIGNAGSQEWSITVGDTSLEAAKEKTANANRADAIQFDANSEGAGAAVEKSDVVISLLPPPLHPTVAGLCLKYKKSLLTASYLSPAMKGLHSEAENSGLLFLNECGLDPGIDHMSAMCVIDRIRGEGGEIFSFESFTGGLIAPDTEPENPWRYKFTWNPRNVVMAGQGTAKFLQNGEFKYIPYQQLFKRVTPVTVPGYGEYEGYANRDSLGYREAYGLQNIQTMLRGTLRNKGFCQAWDILVQLGCTEDSYQMEGVGRMTHHDFMNSFLGFHPEWSVEEKLVHLFHLRPEGPELTRLNWSGLFDNELIGLEAGTPAQILEHILNKRWKLSSQDKDFIIMWHRFRYRQSGVEKEIQAELVSEGQNAVHTAMARTVGLPLGIACKLFLDGKISSRGVRIPVTREFYIPILAELNALGIGLNEREL
ncbi:MAG: saccharopine dehydrogenase NADP-binding domain-containing protein [Bacteroidetes bacterium]|nr:saccharopine dehydrogenase NADP-binding domain-containing protein [Bacteroidota bacterium]